MTGTGWRHRWSRGAAGALLGEGWIISSTEGGLGAWSPVDVNGGAHIDSDVVTSHHRLAGSRMHSWMFDSLRGVSPRRRWCWRN